MGETRVISPKPRWSITNISLLSIYIFFLLFYLLFWTNYALLAISAYTRTFFLPLLSLPSPSNICWQSYITIKDLTEHIQLGFKVFGSAGQLFVVGWFLQIKSGPQVKIRAIFYCKVDITKLKVGLWKGLHILMRWST